MSSLLNERTGLFVSELLIAGFVIYKLSEASDWIFGTSSGGDTDWPWSNNGSGNGTSATDPPENLREWVLLQQEEWIVVYGKSVNTADRYTQACRFVVLHADPSTESYQTAIAYLDVYDNSGNYEYEVLHQNEVGDDAEYQRAVDWVLAHPDAVSANAVAVAQQWMDHLHALAVAAAQAEAAAAEQNEGPHRLDPHREDYISTKTFGSFPSYAKIDR